MEITLDELKIIADEQGFDIVLLEKDYILTYLLYLIKDVKHIYFKGGTALNKIFLNHERLSEDLDFTLTSKLLDVEKNIKNKIKGTIFTKITHDKRVHKFVRLIVHYKLFHEEGIIFMDLNERAKLLLKTQKIEIPHFYSEQIPKFKIVCLHKNEIIAEKILAMCQRYRPRDYLDIYHIIKRKIPVSMNLVRRKFIEDGKMFSRKLIFKKTNKIFNEWNEDLLRLTKSKPSFKDVIQTLSKFFKYEENKKKLKKTEN